MPNAFRVYTTLKGAGVEDEKALAVAAVIAVSKAPEAIYNEEEFTTVLFEAGIAETLAEAICRAAANCFLSQRFHRNFNPTVLQTALVRGGWALPIASAFLGAIDPCIVTPRKGEVRAPIRYVPSPGRVLMCDFTYLQRPEMQKERRAIVVSTKAASGVGRCIVVPVSKSRPVDPNPHHHKFEPGAYPFFHPADPVWAVCDHLYTVSLARLWQVNIRDKPTLPAISEGDFEAIKALIGTTFGV